MLNDEAWDLVRHLRITLLFLGMVLIFLGGAARGLKALIVEAIKELLDDADERDQYRDEDETPDESGEA